jgi:hypothetical protein
MTNEQPINEGRVWFVNGSETSVDIFVNYQDQPTLTDVKAMEIGPVLPIGAPDRPYGEYTFEARAKGLPNSPVLASASIEVEQTESYHAAFHKVGDDEYRISIHALDFSASAETRLEVRHLAFPSEIDWRIEPAAESDPRIPDDFRSGTLQHGEWQQALDVTENQYYFEVTVGGEVVAYQKTIEQELNKMLVVFVVGDLQPNPNETQATARVLVDEIQIPTGPKNKDIVTAPAPPASDVDDSLRVSLECDTILTYETNVAEGEADATDPDGVVTGMAIHSVDPASGSFEIPDGAFDFAENIGDTLTATLRCSPDNLPGSYNVRLKANPESLGERATRDVLVDVRAIDLARLRDLVNQYEASGDIRKKYAEEMRDELDKVDRALNAGNTEKACKESEKFIKTASDNKDAGVSEPATVDIEVEGGRFRKNIGC